MVHPMVLKPLLFPTLFRRLKNTVLYPPGIGNSPTLTSSKRTQKSQYSVYNRGPRGKANAQRFFYWWTKCRCIRVPSKVAFVCALAQTDCPPPTCVVSSSTYPFGWTDHGAVTASSGANTTKIPKKKHPEQAVTQTVFEKI